MEIFFYEEMCALQNAYYIEKEMEMSSRNIKRTWKISSKYVMSGLKSV